MPYKDLARKKNGSGCTNHKDELVVGIVLLLLAQHDALTKRNRKFGNSMDFTGNACRALTANRPLLRCGYHSPCLRFPASAP